MLIYSMFLTVHYKHYISKAFYGDDFRVYGLRDSLLYFMIPKCTNFKSLFVQVLSEVSAQDRVQEAL